MKTLYIGIGGNGVKTLAAIKRKMGAYEQFAVAHGNPVNNNDEFLFIDTDTKDIKGIPGFRENEDYVSLNITPATQYAYEKDHFSADASRFLEWYDPIKTRTSHTPLDSGAGAIRMDGRLGLYASRADFRNKLWQKMSDLNQAADDPNLRSLPMNVYVFSGTSGGTGSGILLDVLMTIDMIYTRIIGDANRTPAVTLFLFGPDQTYTIETDADTKTKKARNGAACLFELDAFKRCTIKNPLGSHKIFNRFSGWVEGLQLTSPFHFPKYVYYLDNTLASIGMAQTQTISYDVMHDLAADFVFNLEVGKLNKFNSLVAAGDVFGIAALDSVVVNGDQDKIDGNGYCQMFNTFAPLSVCFPKELFSLYCSTRFNVECFRALRGNECVRDINSKKNTFKTNLETKIDGLKISVKTIFDNAQKSKKTVANGIAVNETEHCIMYNNADAPDFYRAMAPVVNQAKESIKNWIYTYFSNMLQEEGVDGVIETVMKCDEMLTSLSENLKRQMVVIPQPGFWQTEASYFNEVLECVYKLIDIEIYDYCSLGNQGILDHVNSNLEALRDAFRAKIQECERKQGSFIGTLNAENSNPMRQYLPRLDTIVSGNEFIDENEFGRVYDNAFTEDYIRTVRQSIFADDQIQTDILYIVSVKDRDRANGIVVNMAKMVGNKFSAKFTNDQGIQNYSNTKILDKLTQLSNNGDNSYQNLLNGHKGALFPTDSAVLNAHDHRTMVLASFNGDDIIRRQYLLSNSDIPVDDAFFTDRVVRFYITNGLCINDISSLNMTYLPQLRNEMSPHPAFSDKRFDIKPFMKDSIYEAMAGGSVELSKDLLTLLMLCLLDVKAGRTGQYTVGTRVDGTVTCKGTTCDYYYQIHADKSIVLAFPTFFDDPTLGITMNDYTDSRGNTLSSHAIGKNYTQQQSIIQETKDCYNHILKGTISGSEIRDSLIRLKSMLKIRLDDNNREYINFSSLFANPRFTSDFETMVIADNISLLGQF